MKKYVAPLLDMVEYDVEEIMTVSPASPESDYASGIEDNSDNI